MKLHFPRSGTLPAFAVAALVLLCSLAGLFDGLNRNFLDWSLRQQAKNTRVPDDAVLVLIDESAIKFMSQTYHLRWPWPRDAYASLFLALHQAGAERIVADLMFLENSEQAELDGILGSYSLAIDGLSLAAPRGEFPVFWNEDLRKENPGIPWKTKVGHVDYEADADGVVRHYLWQDSLASSASAYVATGKPLLLRWYGGLKNLPADKVLSAQSFLEAGYGPKGLMALLHRAKVDEYDPAALHGAFPKLPPVAGGLLKGKTVFVGTNAAATFDVKAMPVGQREPGVLVHFTAWGNASQEAFIPELGNRGLFSVSTMAALFLAFAVTGWGWNRPDVRLLSWITLLGILFFISFSYFLLPFFSFPPAAPAGTLFLAFGFLTTRHWMEESRRKREVQELFGSYVSPAVVRRLVENPESLKVSGEKKELSVYFSDLAGFTGMSETMEPEELVDLVNLYLSEMSDFIIGEGGYLDKYIGDAIMGVFGAPEPLENHALSACRAAVRSRAHLKELNKRLAAGHAKELYARIGINTGDMIVGNLGSARKRNYTVVGDSVNLASRLEGANKEFGTTILLGPRTEELARESILTRPVELLQVKGKTKPVQTYELIALKNEATAQEQEFSSVFSRAYDNYQKRRFDQSLIDFESAALIYPVDGLTQLYLERCRHFLLEPPPAAWDGVFEMKRK